MGDIMIRSFRLGLSSQHSAALGVVAVSHDPPIAAVSHP
jgi:hypothetical protein